MRFTAGVNQVYLPGYHTSFNIDNYYYSYLLTDVIGSDGSGENRISSRGRMPAVTLVQCEPCQERLYSNLST